MIPLPALPEAKGPDPRRAAFFQEAAAGFELLALWHSLPAVAQTRLRESISAAAAEVAAERLKERDK